eukprot:Sspe_Gene.67499::Locus_39821_Transcript_1_1_Confidence_1.000_Length_644::g.67499::m.67499
MECQKLPIPDDDCNAPPAQGTVVIVSDGAADTACPPDYAPAAAGTALCGIWGLLGHFCCCPSQWGRAGAMLGCMIYCNFQALCSLLLMVYAIAHPDTMWCNVGYHLDKTETMCCQQLNYDRTCDTHFRTAPSIPANVIAWMGAVFGAAFCVATVAFFFAHRSARQKAMTQITISYQ